MTVETVGAALVGSAVYSVVFYYKEHEDPEDPENLEPKKMLATLVVGLGIGVSFALTEQDLTFLAFEEQMAAYAGIVAVVESGIKTVYRRLKKNGFI